MKLKCYLVYVYITGSVYVLFIVIYDCMILSPVLSNKSVLKSTNGSYIYFNTVEADKLFNKVKVLCWVNTFPKNHIKKAKHVKATWGKRCNVLLFMSSSNDTSLPTIALDVPDGRKFLWRKARLAFKYIYDHNLGDADWFIRADDDTYLILENLRYMLSIYNSSFPIHFGSKFRHFSKQGFMSEGGGDVLSKEALRMFVEKALPNPEICPTADRFADDAILGKCLDAIGVLSGDSRDENSKGRFFPLSPSYHISSGPVDKTYWYWDYIYYNTSLGIDCCSETAISFHYVTPGQMHILEYFLYRLHPHGILPQQSQYPLLPPDKKSIPQDLLDAENIRSGW